MAEITYTSSELVTLRGKLLAAFDVRAFGAKGDGTHDDTSALQAAMDAAASRGGGTVFLPSGTYLTTQPITLRSGVNVFGDSQTASTIHKTGDATNASGMDAVATAIDCNRFQVANLRLVGNRRRDPLTGVVHATSDGISLCRCSYFAVRDVRAQMANVGARLKTCWCGSLEHFVAERCQGYGFSLSDSCTSLVLQNTVAWGTGGGWKLVGVIYSTIISPACDHSDAGGRPDDPFLPEGSGGNYRSPAYVFYLAATTATIISPGCENGYSQYMYCEGAQVALLNPYVYNLQAHAETWRFLQLRGTGASNVEVLNPEFRNVINALTPGHTRCGLYVENPAVQSLTFNRVPKVSDSFAEYAYSKAGIYETARQPYTHIAP